MIAAIKNEKIEYDKQYSLPNVNPTRRYRIFPNEHNQTSESWCYDILDVANINNLNLKSKWEKYYVIKSGAGNLPELIHPPQITHNQRNNIHSFWYSNPDVVIPAAVTAAVVTAAYFSLS